jgi:MoxR-like ATPase
LANSILDVADSVTELLDQLEEHNYLADTGLGTALLLALKLQKPLLLEGLAGCGKTEIARTLAPMLGTNLIRLQCYEGINTYEALYDWDYSRQLLHLRAVQGQSNGESTENHLYTERYLLERPLLKALRQENRPVLLLDELDRADADFEAFLLEFLEEFQVTIPEIGTIKAEQAPIVIITSNQTRELHDALKRRCIYYWVKLPSQAFEEKIIRLRFPDIDKDLAAKVSEAVARIRTLDLIKQPGTSEAIDWARALTLLKSGKQATADEFKSTLSVVLKNQEDQHSVEDEFDSLVNVS